MISQGYLIDTQLCIAALWLFYIALLHRRTNLTAARLYLLGMLPVAMLLPLLRIPLLPAARLQELMIPMAVEPADMGPATGITAFQILTRVYWGGAILAGLLAILGIARAWRRAKKAPARTTGADRIVFSPDVAGAYSAFGTIFVNDKYEESPMLEQILAHERSHIGHRHSLDLVWMNLWRSLLWFNPFVWHAFKLLREVHEFQADRDVIRQGTAVEMYVDLLICAEAGIYPGTANALCYSLTKKRLKMITRATRSMSVGGYLRLAALLPLTGLLLGAFSLTAKADEPPLVIIDGKAYIGLSSIPAKKYESITFLTGEDATGQYGEQGRSGVFIITTSKSRKPSGTVPRGALSINGEIRVPKEGIIGRSGSFDSTKMRNITVRITQKEKENGVTAASKLQKDYPDIFHTTSEGYITNVEPVSIRIETDE